MGDYRVVVADDHALFRQGIKRIIDEVDDIRVVGEASNGLDLLEMLKRFAVDMIILDISMPNLRGIEALKELKKVYPSVKVVIVTMHKKIEYLQEALSTGAEGYILKEDTDGELIAAIKAVRQNKIYISEALSDELKHDVVRTYRFEQSRSEFQSLTIREKEVLKLIAEGKSNKEIAEALFISVRTVESHRGHIMQKLGFKKVAELIRYGIKKGYVNDF